MTYVFIKIDFDRDAAFPIKGFRHAVSKPLQDQKEVINDPEKSISIKGTALAFNQFMEILEEK